MADRAYPKPSAPLSGDSHTPSSQATSFTTRPTSPSVPQPGTYVIQIPKDQVYRVPPPENACRYDQFTRRKNRRSRCCRCLSWLIDLFIALIILLGIAAAILYLVFKPEVPDYTVNSIAIKGMNLTSASAVVSPEFDVAIWANNPNNKIGIYYEKDSSVEIYYKEVKLCDGALPVFFQPSNNVTVFESALKGSWIELRSSDFQALVDAQKKAEVPLVLKLRAPVKIRVGSVKTWTFTVKVDCDVTVDNLTTQAKIVSRDCGGYSVNLWR